LDPHIKVVGDISGTGTADIVIPSSSGGPLVWYEAPGWERHQIAEAGKWSCDALIVDMDGDGDGDLLISEWYGLNRLEWFENPLPDGNPRTDEWNRHEIGQPKAHNIVAADLDGDGHLEIVTRQQGDPGGEIVIWKSVDGEWRSRSFVCPVGEGMDAADINADGRPEIVIGGRWYTTPPDVLAGDFVEHVFTRDWAQDAMVRCADINGDGRIEVLLARSEGPGHLSWFQPPPDPESAEWEEHVIDDSVDYVHSLRAGDLARTGRLDVIAAEMHQSARKRVIVYRNSGDSLSWEPQILSDRGSHAICVGDTTGDGYPDIVGANWSGEYQPVELWINLSGQPEGGG
jgi:hypothetical protein